MKQPIYTGAWGKCHIQGIAVDKKEGFIYYSYTTKLVKATLDGEVIGPVDGLLGHLGCIAYNEADGYLYGSLEYKNDSIGKGILKKLGEDGEGAQKLEDAFYIARFDVSKIDRLDMNAETDGIMKCIYLSEVVKDYLGEGRDKQGRVVPHRYGCSGIDGTTFGPLPGHSREEGMYLYVAYGIYSDFEREDNDHQILLCYDVSDWDSYASPLNQHKMHKSGPDSPLHKFFVYTGNTYYGVQNLEYDSYTGNFFMAVYKGRKPEFKNYSLFAVDGSVEYKREMLRGLDEEGELLTTVKVEREEGAASGWSFPYGSTGLYSFGDGRWLISENRVCTEGQCSYIFQYRWNGIAPFVTEGDLSD